MPRTRKIRYVPAIISGNGCEKFGSKSLKPRICFTESGRNVQPTAGSWEKIDTFTRIPPCIRRACVLSSADKPSLLQTSAAAELLCCPGGELSEQSWRPQQRDW